MDKVKYKEEQKFGSPALIAAMGVLYSGAIGFLFYGIYNQIILGNPVGDEPMSDNGLFIMTALILLVLSVSAYLLFGSKLTIKITSEDISVTFKPFINKPVVFRVSEIDRYEIRKYKPIKEYGSWGVKVGLKKYGRAYNVRGNIGLQLYLKNGIKVLLGTQRQEAIAHAMKKMMESKK